MVKFKKRFKNPKLRNLRISQSRQILYIPSYLELLRMVKQGYTKKKISSLLNTDYQNINKVCDKKLNELFKNNSIKIRIKILTDYWKNYYKNGGLNPMKGEKRPDFSRYNSNKKGKKLEELYGIKKAKEIKKNNSEKHKGYKNSSWKNGISKEPYPFNFDKELKMLIRKRNNFICQLCFKKRKLLVHHIDYNKKNSNSKNLISLCRSCHAKTGHKRKYYKQYFKKWVKKWKNKQQKQEEQK